MIYIFIVLYILRIFYYYLGSPLYLHSKLTLAEVNVDKLALRSS